MKTGHVPLGLRCLRHGQFQDQKRRSFPHLQWSGRLCAHGGLSGQRRDGAWSWRLREGSQHSQEGFIPFINRVIEKARSLTSRKLLVRLDSAHDALDTRVALAGHRNVSYIIKWNPRREDQLEWARRIFDEGEVITPRLGKRVGLAHRPYPPSP